MSIAKRNANTEYLKEGKPSSAEDSANSSQECPQASTTLPQLAAYSMPHVIDEVSFPMDSACPLQIARLSMKSIFSYGAASLTSEAKSP